MSTTKKSGESPLISLAPVFLSERGKTGLFSPGARSEGELIEAGIKALGAMGLKLKRPLGLRRGSGSLKASSKNSGALGSFDYLAASDAFRLREICSLMSGGDLEALLAVRGGHGSLRLLPLLEPLWKSFPAHKPIIGFSDVTALHLARLSAAGAGGWHGPNLLYYTRKNHKNYLEFLRGLKPREWLFGKGEVLVPGETAGPVMGGNLTIFAHVYGTGYSPPSKGRILLLEDVGEKPYAIDRLLTTLLLRGAFEGALGVVLGSFASCGNPGELRDLILHFFQSFKIPVLINAPFGHGIENRPWFYGERGVLFASRRAGGRLFFPLEN